MTSEQEPTKAHVTSETLAARLREWSRAQRAFARAYSERHGGIGSRNECMRAEVAYYDAGQALYDAIAYDGLLTVPTRHGRRARKARTTVSEAAPAGFDPLSQTDNTRWEDFTADRLRDFIREAMRHCANKPTRDDLDEYGCFGAIEELHRRALGREEPKG